MRKCVHDGRMQVFLPASMDLCCLCFPRSNTLIDVRLDIAHLKIDLAQAGIIGVNQTQKSLNRICEL